MSNEGTMELSGAAEKASFSKEGGRPDEHKLKDSS